MMRALLLIAVCAGLAGCMNSAVTVPGRLAGPSSWTMVAPQPLAAPKAGDDAKELLGQCRAAYGAETGKLLPLQTYVRRVTRKPATPKT